MEEAKKNILRKYLTKDAIERLGRVRVAHPELAQKAETVIIQAARTGQIRKVREKDLKGMLKELSSGKKSFRILK